MTIDGDRRWREAGSETLADLAGTVRKRARDVRKQAGPDAVHDMRTATRRLRTAVSIFGSEADKAKRRAVERELHRVAARLGTVRDMDVLLRTLSRSGRGNGGSLSEEELEPLRRAWERERRHEERRLLGEIRRRRLRRALRHASRLVRTDDAEDRSADDAVVHRVADRAPALIWAAFGDVMAHEIDPKTAEPALIHAMRIDAKHLRYTLEAFEDALPPGCDLMEQVTALQDAGGEMHDAVVAGDRAAAAIDRLHLRGPEAAAAQAFAKGQSDEAKRRRPIIKRRMATVRGRAFRQSLARAVVEMTKLSGGS